MEDALNRAAVGSLRVPDVEALCAIAGGSRSAVLDSTARIVAERFLAGSLDFPTADAVANCLFAYGASVGDVPDLMHSIFLAFDAGELVHSGDPPSTDPVANYTRPQLIAALSKSLVAP